MATRKPKRASADGGLVAPILEYLETQSDVIEAQRVNSGGMKVGDRFVRFAKAGSFDIRGYFRSPGMRTALAFEIEVKKLGGELNENQLARIRDVLEPGNVPHCVARSVTDVIVFMGELRAIGRAVA